MVEGIRPLSPRQAQSSGSDRGLVDIRKCRTTSRVEPMPFGERSQIRRQARARRVRHLGGDRSAARRGRIENAARCKIAEGRRRRCGQRARRTARAKQHGRAAHQPAHRAAGRDRDGHTLLLPRPQPPRHAVRPARRRCDRTSQSPDHHRRSAEDGAVPECDSGVRHRLHRAHEPREQAEPRAGSGRKLDRDADVSSLLASA